MAGILAQFLIATIFCAAMPVISVVFLCWLHEKLHLPSTKGVVYVIAVIGAILFMTFWLIGIFLMPYF